jgi:hypothetical protein
MASTVAERRGPVVEVLPPAGEQLPPLDPDARPTTPLGALRARYFPIWASDFDGAFPPDACGTAWELDGIARPVTNVDVSLYGDARIMAALAVMRYEYLLSRALTDPTPLAQLCVAVGAVDPARAEALGQLATRIDQSRHGRPDEPSEPSRTSEPSQANRPSQPDEPSQSRGPGQPSAPSSAAVGYPDAVTILASGPSVVIAAACIPADREGTGEGARDRTSTGRAATGQASERPDGARVGAYLLRVAQGIEDRVVDVSFRVAQVRHRVVAGCSALDAWEAEWDEHVAAWIAEGQAWVPTRIVVTAEHICTPHAADGAHDCPQEWRS